MPGTEPDPLSVLLEAARAAGIPDKPETASHPHGRSHKTFRIGGAFLWKDESLAECHGGLSWVVEHRGKRDVVSARYTYGTLEEAAADAVTLIVRENVRAVLESLRNP